MLLEWFGITIRYVYVEINTKNEHNLRHGFELVLSRFFWVFRVKRVIQRFKTTDKIIQQGLASKMNLQ